MMVVVVMLLLLSAAGFLPLWLGVVQSLPLVVLAVLVLAESEPDPEPEPDPDDRDAGDGRKENVADDGTERGADGSGSDGSPSGRCGSRGRRYCFLLSAGTSAPFSESVSIS